MKIGVFGTGYVGLVTGVCFADMGNDVLCVDVDPQKIKMLWEGKSPIYEPGLDDLLENNIKAKRIQFTTDSATAIEQCDLLFIAVGTPSDVDGSADLKYVLQVAQTIGQHMKTYKLVINKSTVPVGTQKKVKDVIQAQLNQRQLNLTFDVASNPEFLREGTAIEDCLKPNRVVVGVESEKAHNLLRRLYEPFLKNGNPFIVMEPASSEMTKYAANAMLATKISLMNEFSRVCEKVGADIEMVRRGIGSDFRIGPHFIFAGVGYGGSCFPKDVKALIHIGDQEQEAMPILNAVEEVNQTQRLRFAEKSEKIMGGLKGKKVALWGVAFKPGTDDIREAPAVDLIEFWLKGGATVTAYDPVASHVALNHFGKNPALQFLDDQYEVLAGADILVVATEWKSFREPNFEKMKSLLLKPIILDGRNIYNIEEMKELGMQYYSIGRKDFNL